MIVLCFTQCFFCPLLCLWRIYFSWIQGRLTVPTCTQPGARISPSCLWPGNMSSYSSSSGWSSDWRLNRPVSGFARQTYSSWLLRLKWICLYYCTILQLLEILLCAHLLEKRFMCFEWDDFELKNKYFSMTYFCIFNLILSLNCKFEYNYLIN